MGELSMKVTAKLLCKKGACREQVSKFQELFPEGVVVTEELCVKHSAVFSWNWAAQNLLPAPAEADYNKAMAPARAEYDKAMAPALAEYNKAVAPAEAEYSKAK